MAIDLQVPKLTPLQWGGVAVAGLVLAYFVRKSGFGAPSSSYSEQPTEIVIEPTATTPGRIPEPVPYFVGSDTPRAPAKPPTATPAPVKPPTATPAPVKPPTATPAPVKPPTATPAPVKPPAPAPLPVRPGPAPAPAPAPAPVAPLYPGLPYPYAMNCAIATKTLFYSNVSIVGGGERGSSFNRRNQLAWAIQGNVTPWIGPTNTSRGYNHPADYASQDRINQIRVRFGLYPLTRQEFAVMVTDLGNINYDTPAEADSERIAQKWNYPYRCGTFEGMRRDR